MKIKLLNKSGTALAFDNYAPFIDGVKRRIRFIDRFSKSGVVRIGDGKADKRKFNLTINITGTTDDEYLNKLNTILEYIQDYNYPLFVIDEDKNRKAEIEIENIKLKETEGTERRVGTLTLSTILLDSAFRLDEQVLTQTLSPQDIIIINISSYLTTYPVIELTTQTSNDNLSVSNITTGDVMSVGNAGFVSGVKMVMDSINGLIYLDDGNNKIDIAYSLDDNSGFIQLTTGENKIQYDSPNGDIDITIKYSEKVYY